MSVRSIVVPQQNKKIINYKNSNPNLKKKRRAQQKHNGIQNVMNKVLLGGRDMRCYGHAAMVVRF